MQLQSTDPAPVGIVHVPLPELGQHAIEGFAFRMVVSLMSAQPRSVHHNSSSYSGHPTASSLHDRSLDEESVSSLSAKTASSQAASPTLFILLKIQQTSMLPSLSRNGGKTRVSCAQG